MAIFNPTVAQGRDDMPSWLKSSQPISELVPDKSGAFGINTAATAIEGGAQLAETTAKGIIDKDVRSTVEPIRDNFTKELELGKAVQQGNVIAPAVQGSSGSMVLQGDDKPPPVPQAIDTGVSKIDSLQSALANGKINDTYYHLRLKDAVTGLRANYPGFTDYIDQKVSQITGVNPANAYINDLMQDINQRQVQKKSAVDKMKDDIMKSGYPHSDQWIQYLDRNGEAGLAAAQQYYSQQTEFDAKFKRKDALRRDSTANKEDLVADRTAEFTNRIGASITSNFNTMLNISGLQNGQSIMKIMEDAAAHPDQYTDAQMRALDGQLMAQKASLKVQLLAQARETHTTSDGRSVYSYNSDMGSPEKANAIIDNQLAVYDTIHDALSKGGPGGAGIAFAHASHAIAKLDDSRDNLMSGNLGDWAAKVQLLQEKMGPNWTTLAITEGLRSNIDKKLQGYLTENTTDARLQPDFDKTGIPITLKDHLIKAKADQDAGKMTEGMRERYAGKLVNLIDDIKNKNAPDINKVNILRYMFSPEGQGVLKSFKTDYKDPDTGNVIPGKYSVWTRMSAPDVVSEVNRLSKADPSIAVRYKSWMENEAGSQLFYKEFQNLNKFTGVDNLSFKYNTGANGGTPNIEVVDKKNPMPASLAPYAPGSTMEQGYAGQVQKIVNRVNTALSGMARVENGLGGDANAYLLDFLQRSQVDLGQNWSGIPEKIMTAIAASRSPARRIEDTFDQVGMPKKK